MAVPLAVAAAIDRGSTPRRPPPFQWTLVIPGWASSPRSLACAATWPSGSRWAETDLLTASFAHLQRLHFRSTTRP